MNKLFRKMRYKAYRKGVVDGHKWAWYKRAVDHSVPFDDFYNPPWFFKKMYGLGFDTGADLELE